MLCAPPDQLIVDLFGVFGPIWMRTVFRPSAPILTCNSIRASVRVSERTPHRRIVAARLGVFRFSQRAATATMATTAAARPTDNL